MGFLNQFILSPHVVPRFGSVQATLLYLRTNIPQSSENYILSYPNKEELALQQSIALLTADCCHFTRTAGFLRRDNIFFFSVLYSFQFCIYHQHSRTASVVVILFDFFFLPTLLSLSHFHLFWRAMYELTKIFKILVFNWNWKKGSIKHSFKMEAK